MRVLEDRVSTNIQEIYSTNNCELVQFFVHLKWMHKRRNNCSHHLKMIVACTGCGQWIILTLGIVLVIITAFIIGFCIHREGREKRGEIETFYYSNGLFYLHPGLTKYKTKSFICSNFLLSDKIMEVVKARYTVYNLNLNLARISGLGPQRNGQNSLSESSED